MKVNKRMLLIGVLLGLITVILLNWYISTLSEREKSAAPTYVEVVVAATTIPKHVVITQEMVSLVSLPEESIHPDAMRSLDAVVGAISRSEIINGEQILSLRIASDEIEATFSYEIPANMRAISIPIDEISGVADHIAVGDKVDILVSYETLTTPTENQPEQTVQSITTYTQLQNIEVLALGRLVPVTTEETTAQQVSSITLLVNPRQAEVVAYANIMGSFHLTLRNPVDEAIVPLDFYNPTNFETFRER